MFQFLSHCGSLYTQIHVYVVYILYMYLKEEGILFFLLQGAHLVDCVRMVVAVLRIHTKLISLYIHTNRGEHCETMYKCLYIYIA